MIKTYKKDQRKEVWISKHFRLNEFKCKCNNPDCNIILISEEMVEKLEQLRNELEEHIFITSAHRCTEHQAYLRGRGLKTSVGKSTHEMALAVDISKDSGGKITRNLLEKYFPCIGEGDQFFHVDLREDKKRYWRY